MIRKMKPFKKRYIVFGLLAIEIVSIPVAAKTVKDFKFEPPHRTISVPFPSEQIGLTSFLVSSNAPFAIISEGSTGQFEINLHLNGEVNGQKFGLNAQMPGEKESCSVQLVPTGTKIYESDRKIDSQDGDVISRAIIIEIRYKEDITPNFKILPKKKSKKYNASVPCTSKLS